jgi:hypothetical protein
MKKGTVVYVQTASMRTMKRITMFLKQQETIWPASELHGSHKCTLWSVLLLFFCNEDGDVLLGQVQEVTCFRQLQGVCVLAVFASEVAEADLL